MPGYFNDHELHQDPSLRGKLHGFFAFYMPFQLATRDAPLFDLGILRYIALPFWTLRAWIIIHCCMDMVRGGGGTPAHMDPPKELIITGLYRHVRNPIYLGALIALVGHILWSGSGWVIAYFLSYAVAFHILIVVFEEPVLRDKLGKQYKEYVANVPRWLPKWNKKDPHH